MKNKKILINASEPMRELAHRAGEGLLKDPHPADHRVASGFSYVSVLRTSVLRLSRNHRTIPVECWQAWSDLSDVIREDIAYTCFAAPPDILGAFQVVGEYMQTLPVNFVRSGPNRTNRQTVAVCAFSYAGGDYDTL